MTYIMVLIQVKLNTLQFYKLNLFNYAWRDTSKLSKLLSKQQIA